MTRHPIRRWAAAAFTANLTVAAGALLWAGAGPRGLDIGLQGTARVGFLLFGLAYAAAPLSRLAGSEARWAGWLRARAACFGLSFAAAQSVHFGLVVWLCAIDAAPARGVFLVFAVPTAAVLGLVLLSAPAVARRVPRGALRSVRALGMHVIALAFAYDFLAAPAHGAKYWLGYLPFILLSLALLALAAMAEAVRLTRPRYSGIVRGTTLPSDAG